jgi:NADP-dependent 3-hydroxy acid dehydrogenase YdfG
MMHSLTGQIALVTGAGSGIGQAIAIALAHEGATTALVGRKKDKLEITAGMSNGRGHMAVMATDLSDDEQLETLVSDLQNTFGHVDLFISSAGEIIHGPLESTPVESFDRLYRHNVRSNYRLTQLLLPLLRKRPGQIVFINSTAGLTAQANVGQFSATQHALKAFTDALRAEVNSDGIRVLSVYPGRVATPRQERLYEHSGQDYKPQLLLQPSDVATIVMTALKLPRTAEVTDIHIRPLLKSY